MPFKIATQIGWIIEVHCIRNGLVSEATKAMINYGFEDMALVNLWCGYYADNELP